MSIEGYGRVSAKALIHALERSEDGNQYVSLCSKTPMDIDPDLNIMQVSCGNCKRLKAYNDAIEQAANSKSKKKKEITTVIIDTEKSELIDIALQVDMETLKKERPKLREIFSDRLLNLEEQFIAKAREDGSFDIWHRLGNIFVFGPLPRNSIAPCLLMLNSYKEQWTGRKRPSKEWIDNIRKLVKAGRAFATDFRSEELDDVFERDAKIKVLQHEAAGLKEYVARIEKEMRELTESNVKLLTELTELNGQLNKAQTLAIDQQVEINALRASKGASKIRRFEDLSEETDKVIKQPEKQQKPIPVRRIKRL